DAGWEDFETDGGTDGAAVRGSWSRRDGLVRLREGAGRGLRRWWLAVAALVFVVAVVLAVVLSGGGRTQNEASGDLTLPTTRARPTRPAAARPTQKPIVVTLAAGRTLSLGDSGPRVRALQRALKRVGHDPGAADGAFGARTQAAVTALQRQEGLA